MNAATLRNAASLLMAGALAGCAAIEINVDVYKGPLANDEAIQLRQYAALAMAAKPVLVMLHKELGGQGPNPTDEANFVGGVLSYYKDKLNGPAAQAQDAAMRSDRSTGFLDTGSRETGERLGAELARNEVAGARNPAGRAYLCAWAGMLGAKTTDTCNRAFSAAGFPEHRSNFRPSRQFFMACLAQVTGGKLHRDACPGDQRATSAFSTLADNGKTRLHAELIFGKSSGDFEAHAQQVGQSYLDARRAVSDLALALLAMLREPAAQRSQTQDAAISRLLSAVVDSNAVACAATGAPAAEVYVKRVFPDTAPDSRQVSSVIGRLVFRDPIGLATALLALDGMARALDSGHIVQCRDKPHATTMKWYGIAAGPRDDDDLNALPDLVGEVGDALGEVAFSWDRGRPTKGIESLYEELNRSLTQHAADPLHNDVQQRVAALTDSLVPFAERLSFVVNNSALFRKGANQFEAERHVLQTLANTLIVHANDLRRRRVHAEGQRRGFDTELLAAQHGSQATPGEVLGILRQSLEAPIVALKQAADAKKVALDLANATAKGDEANNRVAEEAYKEASSTLRKLNTPLEGVLAAAAIFDPKAAEKTREMGLKALPSSVINAMRESVDKSLKKEESSAGATKEFSFDEMLKVLESRIREAAGAFGEKTGIRKSLIAAADAFKQLPVDTTAPKAKFAAQRNDVVKARLVEFESALDVRKSHAKFESERKALRDASAETKKKSATAAEKARLASTTANDELAAAEKVRDLATGLFPMSLRRAAADSPVSDPEAVRQAVLQELAAAKAGASSGDTKAYTEALALVLRPTLPLGLPFKQDGLYTRLAVAADPANRDKPFATRFQVMSDIIALLQKRHIAALADPGRGNAAALAEAIKTATDYRNEQVFLRPASEYLRSVYASTVIGQNWRDPERNLLLDYLRQLGPDRRISQAVSSAGDLTAPTLQRELDSLFWQNVNRVSLSGGGDANYAIAKDDVGNWYVKSYSVDPERVFRSARSIALFNMGQKLDMNLLDRADARALSNSDKKEDRDRGDARLAAISARSGPGAQFADSTQKRAARRYFEQLQEARDALKLKFSGLNAELKPDWEAKAKAAKDAYDKEPIDPNKAKPEISFKIDELLKTAENAREASEIEAFALLDKLTTESMEKQGSYSAYGRALTEAMRKFQVLGIKILDAISQQSAATMTDALKAELKANVTTRVNGHVNDLAAGRQRAVQTYQDTLKSLVSAAVAD
jgi:hypothetical protein